jgi:aminotransferase
MKQTTISRDLDQLMQSEIRNMSIECDKVGGINLSQGVCDLPLAQVLREGLLEAVDAGCNHYTRYDGIDALRVQIARKTASFNGFTADPATEICVSAGATGALYCACYATLHPGDEVLLFEPYYGYHEHTLLSLGLVPVYAKLTPPNWNFSLDELERLTTDRTKAILINTPSNPCGKVFTRQELEQLGNFTCRHDLLVFTDEIYEYITYDGREHISPASIPTLHDRTITISGFSKTFSITGWRIGYSIAPPNITERIGAVNDLIYVCAPAPLQFSVARALETLPDAYYRSMCTDYQEKRDLLCSTLQEVGLTPYIPQGAYYVLADISALPGKNSKERAMWLLENAGIGMVPGKSFYKSGGETIARFCFAKDKSVIEQACTLLRKNYKKWEN